LRTQSWKAPWSLRVVAFHAAFTAAVRVIHRVHRHAAHRRTPSVPARAARLSVGHILMIQIAELANRGHTIHAEFSYFPVRQLDQRKITLFAQQLRGTAG